MKELYYVLIPTVFEDTAREIAAELERTHPFVHVVSSDEHPGVRKAHEASIAERRETAS